MPMGLPLTFDFVFRGKFWNGNTLVRVNAAERINLWTRDGKRNMFPIHNWSFDLHNQLPVSLIIVI